MHRQITATNFHTNNSNNIKVTTTLKTASNVPTNSSNLKSSGNCTNKQMQQTHSNDDSSSNQQQQQTTSDNSVDKSSSSNELTIDGSLHSHGSSEWSYNNRCLPENGNFNFKWSESFFAWLKLKCDELIFENQRNHWIENFQASIRPDCFILFLLEPYWTNIVTTYYLKLKFCSNVVTFN